MLQEYRKILLVSLFLLGFINFPCVFASSDFTTTGDIAASLSDVIDQNKKEISKIIKSNKRLIKSLKGLNSKDKTIAAKTVNDLGSSIESGDEQSTIENTLDDLLNQTGQ